MRSIVQEAGGDPVGEFSELLERDFGVVGLAVEDLDEGDFVFVVFEVLLPGSDDVSAFVEIDDAFGGEKFVDADFVDDPVSR